MRRDVKIKMLHGLMLRWFHINKRSLSWREARDPYTILVSEIMLQQTQVSRVEKKLPEFIRRFPTLERLASASTASVIRAWQGMGYNVRALRLRHLAQQIVQNNGGMIPSDIDQLTRLPGIGKYTAHALACFAHRKNVPVVDVNISRVLSRVFWQMRTAHQRKDPKTIWNLAETILPKRHAYVWNEALMDFGATICTSLKPLCSTCALDGLCSSYGSLFAPTKRVHRVLRREPLYDGIPTRIYRGRIVEQLRHLRGNQEISAYALGKLIKPGFTHTETRWMHGILKRLRRDGLVRLNRQRNTLFASLPHT